MSKKKKKTVNIILTSPQGKKLVQEAGCFCVLWTHEWRGSGARGKGKGGGGAEEVKASDGRDERKGKRKISNFLNRYLK